MNFFLWDIIVHRIDVRAATWGVNHMLCNIPSKQKLPNSNAFTGLQEPDSNITESNELAIIK